LFDVVSVLEPAERLSVLEAASKTTSREELGTQQHLCIMMITLTK